MTRGAFILQASRTDTAGLAAVMRRSFKQHAVVRLGIRGAWILRH